MAQPWVLLPHKHIQISLPFAPKDDQYTNMIPLGEKIEHNASNGTPDGHPGIDFQWNKKTRILAVADGRIMRVFKDKSGKYNIEQSFGAYKAVYKELNETNPKIHSFSYVKKGEFLGYSGYLRTDSQAPKESDPSRQIHWDFGSSSMIIDRLCPVTYFDKESRERIEAIWKRVPSNDRFKSQYSEICNGIFKDKVD